MAAAACACSLLACSDPVEPTDLRSQSSGPPNVTAVTVMSDLASSADPDLAGLPRLIETATHCRTDDEKRPGIVGLPDFTTTQVCPDDLARPADDESVAAGAPPAWFVRVVFDKLLDTDVEDLIDTASGTIGTFAMTQPVTLRCGIGSLVDVPYDGYYVPNGNRVSWPLGPALYVAPLSAASVPTGAQCEVTLRDKVRSKVGQAVPDDQRTYTFAIGPMQYRFAIPDSTDGSAIVDVGTPVQLYWTAAVGATAGITMTRGPNTATGDADPSICDGSAGTPVPDVVVKPHGDDPEAAALILDLASPQTTADIKWDAQTTYRIAVSPTAKVAPAQGGADGTFPDGFTLCFHTGENP